jgi:hypothetical protein
MPITASSLLDTFRENLLRELDAIEHIQADLCRALEWPTSRLSSVLYHNSPKLETIDEIAEGLRSLGWAGESYTLLIPRENAAS